MPVFCLLTLGRHCNFTAGVTSEQPDLLRNTIYHLLTMSNKQLNAIYYLPCIRNLKTNNWICPIHYSGPTIKQPIWESPTTCGRSEFKTKWTKFICNIMLIIKININKVVPFVSLKYGTSKENTNSHENLLLIYLK
jgi:hypothetical protein